MELQNFSVEDWYTVIAGMSSAASIVSMSDVSGPLGLVKEAMASTAALREDASQSAFIAALRAQMTSADKEDKEALMKVAMEKQQAMKGQAQTTEEAQQIALDTMRDAIQLVEEKAGAEAAADYKQLIWAGAQKAAKASKEGGFLGIGGKLVSEAELAALQQVKAALGL